jgi:hypothetical protein
MTQLIDLNQPDEGLAGGGLPKTRGGKSNRTPHKETLKVELERRKSILNIDRMTWYPNWRDLADHFRPYRGRWFEDSSDTNKGWRRNWRIVDSTPLIAGNTLAAGLLAGATSPSRPWFKYGLEDDALLEAEGVKAWLDTATKKARAILNKSNFYNCAYECYGEYGIFGVMALGREWAFGDELPHFQPFTIGSYYIGNDKHRRVNVFYRDFKWTVQQIVDRFATGPLEEEASWVNISAQVRSMWNNKQFDVMIDLVHAVDENLDRKKGASGEYKMDASGMRFRSCYYERGGDPSKVLENSDANQDNKKILRMGGFRDFPVWVARWYTNSEDAWARGPAMDALGDARALQLQQKRKAQSIDRLVDPPMKAHPSLRNQRTSMLPGDVTFVAPEQGSVGFEPVYEIKPDIQALLEDIRETQGRINDMLFTNIFAMFITGDEAGQKQPITAAEVNARQQEKLLMLGPVLENMNYEFLNPMHQWLFAEMMRHGELPPPPQAMRGQDIKVEYSSILAQAIQQVTAGSIQQFMGFVGQVAQLSAQGAQNPGLDKVNFDEAIEEYAIATGVPATIVRSDADVDAIRQQRQKVQDQQAAQEQQAATAQAALAHSTAINKMGNTPLGQGSALDAAVGASPVSG